MLRYVVLLLVALPVVSSLDANYIDLDDNGIINTFDLSLMSSVYNIDFYLSDLVLLGRYFNQDITVCGDVACQLNETPMSCPADCDDGQPTGFTKTFVHYFGGNPDPVNGDEVWIAKYDLFDTTRYFYYSINGTAWPVIKALNPDIEIYLYVNGPRVDNSQDGYQVRYLNALGRYNISRGHSMGSLNLDHPDWFLLGGGGERVYDSTYSDVLNNVYKYHLDFGNSSFAQYWCEAVINDTFFHPWTTDGVFSDNNAPLLASSMSTVPVKYSTDVLWSSAMNNFTRDTAFCIQNIGKKIWANRGYSSKQAGFDAWLALDNETFAPDLIMEEGFVVMKYGSDNDVQFLSPDDWLRQVRALSIIQKSGITTVSHTDLLPGGSGVDNFGNNVSFWQAMWFSWASFHLGEDANDYFLFYSDKLNATDWWYDEYEVVDLGNSLGVMQNFSTTNGSLFYREYDLGYVFVNPNYQGDITIDFSESLALFNHSTYRDAYSQPYSSRFTIPKLSGFMALKFLP